MQNIKKTVALGGAFKISTEDNEPIATFDNSPAGRLAYGAFVTGLAQGREFNLYDGDTGQFIAGDLSA